MSKSGSRSGGHKRGKKTALADTPRPASDGAIYFGLVIIGAAIVALGLLLSEGEGSLTGWFAIGFLAFIAWLTNLSAINAYRGRRLPPWRQALARLPLRCAGFGKKGGKPVEAAHDAPAARTMIIVSIVFSVVVLLVLAYFLVPDIREMISG